VLQYVAVRCSVLQCVAVCCSALQCFIADIPDQLSRKISSAVIKYSKFSQYLRRGKLFNDAVARVLQCVAVRCSVLRCVAVCCGVLRCVAVCYSVLQCVAVRCSVLQCATDYQFDGYLEVKNSSSMLW